MRKSGDVPNWTATAAGFHTVHLTPPLPQAALPPPATPGAGRASPGRRRTNPVVHTTASLRQRQPEPTRTPMLQTAARLRRGLLSASHGHCRWATHRHTQHAFLQALQRLKNTHPSLLHLCSLYGISSNQNDSVAS